MVEQTHASKANRAYHLSGKRPPPWWSQAQTIRHAGVRFLNSFSTTFKIGHDSSARHIAKVALDFKTLYFLLKVLW